MSAQSYYMENRTTYDQLRKEAERHVRVREYFLTEPIVSVMHISIEPAWGFPIGWLIFYLHTKSTARNIFDGATAYVERVAWNRDEDSERGRNQPPDVFTPIPTLYIDRIALDTQKFDALMQEGKNIPVPLIGVRNRSVGYDGAECTLRMEDDPVAYTLHWWSHGPEEWQPVTAWVFKFIRFLDESLKPVSTIPRPAPPKDDTDEEDDIITEW